MSIRKHPTMEDAWYIEYYPEGRKGGIKREVYIGDELGARNREREVRRLHCYKHRSLTNARIMDILDDYLDDLKMHNKPSYYNSMTWALKKLKPHFGHLPVSQITEQTFMDYKKKRLATPRACNQEIEYLTIIINWMVRKGYAQALPFKPQKLRVPKKLPRPCSIDEWDRFLARYDEKVKEAGIPQHERDVKRAILMIIYDTGIRWVEARHIRWENIDWREGAIYLGVTKTDEPRFALPGAAALELLKPYKQTSGYVCLNPRTKEPYKSFKTMFRNARLDGIPIKGTHTLRHATGTDSLNSTGDLRGTQVILGHADLRSTQIYTRVALERQKELVASLQAYREKKRTKSPPASTKA